MLIISLVVVNCLMLAGAFALINWLAGHSSLQLRRVEARGRRHRDHR